MFQYALGRRLALDRNIDLKLDTSWYQKHSSRAYLLNAFDIRADIVEEEDIKRIVPLYYHQFWKIPYLAIQNHIPYRYRKMIIEPSILFSSKIIREAPQNVFLIGYWQSEKYFQSISSLLRHEFEIIKPLSSSYLYWREKILKDITVSLHIRRGDYVTDQKYTRKYATCKLDYYEKAINFLQSLLKRFNIFVFSNDHDWAKNNFFDIPQIKFIKQEKDLTDYEELKLMSLCNHHIIANSTYSWWGAWLNNKPNKIVIAPQRWFNDPRLETQSKYLLPKQWIKM